MQLGLLIVDKMFDYSARRLENGEIKLKMPILGILHPSKKCAHFHQYLGLKNVIPPEIPVFRQKSKKNA